MPEFRRHGTWQHFKGGLYTFLYVATLEDTDVELIIYQDEDTGEVYARPHKEWEEQVEDYKGEMVPRFRELRCDCPTYVGNGEDPGISGVCQIHSRRARDVRQTIRARYGRGS